MSTPTYLEVNISQIQNLDISGNTTIGGNTSIRGNTTISGSVRADSSFNVISDTSLSRIQIQNTTNSQYIHMSLSGLSFTGALSPQSATVFVGVANSVSYSVTQTELSFLSGVNKSIQQQFADMSSNTQAALSLRAPLANPTFTGTVSGITKSMVGLGSVDNTSDVNKPISTATQSALDAKAPIDSPTFTGTISGITKAMVGLGNVDNTSDANKPVSTATQTALNLRAFDASCVHLAGAETISGDKTFTGNVIANSSLITPTQLSYLADMSLSLLTAFNTRPVYSQLLAAANTWTGVNTFNTNHVAVSRSISMAGAAPDTDGSLYFSTTLTNRKIVFYKGFNNEYQNYSMGVQAGTMQFMVFTTWDGFTFSGGASSTSKTDFARIDNNGVNIYTGTLLLNGTDLFARNNTWTGINTFNTNNVAVSKSIGIGGATVQADGGVYFSTTATNRKLVLYPVANNEFQNMSIGATASSMQFMVDNTGDSYVFSAATSSTAKTDYATLNNTGLSVTKSIGIAGATIQATNGIYFPNGDNNRMIVFYNGNVAAPNAFQNHSIGKGSYTMQFLVDNTQNRYTFSAATSNAAKTDYALIGNTGVDIKMGSLLIAGTDIFARNNTWSGINTFSASISANAKTITTTQLGYLSDLSMTFLDAFNVRPVYSQLLAATQTWSGVNTFTGNMVANAKTVTPTQLGYLSDLSLSLLDEFNSRPVYGQLLASTQTWTGLNTFSTNNVAVSKSIGLGGATVDADGGVYFPNTITNRKLVLYRMANNEFQNYSIGIQSFTLQFMVNGNTAGYTFSAATSSTSKSDYVRIDNGGINIYTGTLKLNNTDIFARTNTWSGTNTFSSAPTMSSGLNVTGNITADGMRISSTATIQATGGIYFPAADLNRKIVLYPVTAGECGNHSIGVTNSGSTTQFMVPNNTSNYVFSYGTGAETKTDIATLSSTGVNIQSGTLSIGGSAYDSNLVHLTGTETIGGDKTFTGTVSGITAAMVGLGNVNNTSDADKPVSTATQTALDAKAPLASPTFTGTVSGITAAMVGLGNVDNTSDANKPISTATQTALETKAPLASPTFTGTVSGITKAMVGLGSVDNTADADKPVSTATQTALNAKANDSAVVHNTGTETIGGAKTFSTGATFSNGLTSSGITMTGNIVSINSLRMGTAAYQVAGALHYPPSNLYRKLILYPVTSNEYQNYSIGVNNTNMEQVYLVPDNTRSHKFSYGTSTTSKSDILVLKSDTSVFNSDVSMNSTLLCGTINSYWLDASLNIRAYDASCVHLTGNETISGNKTFTGTVAGITATMVGLGNVDNTSDLNKPVSIAVQSALDAKAPLANPVFTGTVSGITKAMVGLGNVDNTSDADKPISTATQTALNAKANISGPNFTGTVGVSQIQFSGGAIQTGGGIYFSSTDLNRKIVLAPGSTTGECTNHSIGTGNGGNVFQFMVPDTNKSYVFSYGTGTSTKTDIATISSAGINVQSGNFLINGTAYDSNLVHLTGAETIAGDKTFTGTIAGITKSMVGLGNVDNTSDANKPVSTATQTALDAKAPLANPTFTGTVSGITASMVGLGNVNNTSDANKPISTATQTALNLRAFDASCVHLTGNETIAGGKTFSNVGINKTATANVLDVSGAVNYDMTSTVITVQNGQFTNFTGYTLPTTNNKTALITNLNGTSTLDGWTWSGAGTNIVYWLRGDNSNAYYSGSPPSSIYYVFNTSYSGNAFYFQQSFSNLTAGNYILTFYSYWGGGTGSLTASLTLSAQNATNTLVYADPETRTTLTWKLRTFFFTITTSGASYVRWTPSDTATAGTAFYWAIGNVSLMKYDGVRLSDTFSSKIAYAGGELSSFNSIMINDASVFNSLSLTGTASLNAAGNNTNCLVINSDFSKATNAANKTCIVLGGSVSPYATTYKLCTHIGYSIQNNASSKQTTCNNTVIIGSSLYGGYQSDVIIGYNMIKSQDTVGENVMIGTNIGTQGAGCGRRSVAIGSSIFGAYNGYGINPTQPLEAVAIGYSSQSVCFDNYNTSVGCYSLQNIIGNANNTGAGQTTAYLTQYNTALGHQAGSGQSLMNNCTYVGALARSTVNNISNATVLGQGSTVGASYATAIGSGVVNNTANSVLIGRSSDFVRVDGSMVLIGDLFTNTNRITQTQLGYLSDFTTTSIKQYVDNNSSSGTFTTNNTWTGSNIFPTLQARSGSTIDGSSNVYMKVGYFADSSNTTFSLKGSSATVPTAVSGFTLINTGAVTTFNSPARGYVFNFSGSNYLSTSTSPITSANCSLSFWVYYTGTNQNNTAVISSLWWPIYYDSNKMTTQLYYTGTALTLVESATRTPNSWVHYTYVVDNSAAILSLYVNGVFDVSGTKAGTFGPTNWGRISNNTNNPFAVGGFTGTAASIKTSYYLGYMDDVRVFARTLTPDEVYSVYLNNTYAPICYYKTVTSNNRSQMVWDFYNSSDAFLDIQYKGASRAQLSSGGLNISTGTVSLGGTDIFARTNTWSGPNTFSNLTLGALSLNNGSTIDGSTNVLGKMSYDVLNEFTLDLSSATIPAAYGSYTITNTGSVTTFNDATRGNVLSFSGTNKLTIPTPIIKSVDCTLAFWVYYTGQNNQTILNSQWWPTYYETNKIKSTIYFTGNPSVTLVESTVKTVNSWNHYSIVIDYYGGRALLYVNGVLDVSASSPGTFTTSTWGRITSQNTGMSIGNELGTGNAPYTTGFVGYLDDVRVYNATLSAMDIQRVVYSTAPAPSVNVPMVYQKRDRLGRLAWDFYNDDTFLDIQYKGASRVQMTNTGVVTNDVIVNTTMRTRGVLRFYRIDAADYTGNWNKIYTSSSRSLVIQPEDNVAGGVLLNWGATSWTSNSDRRLKENIFDISGSLVKINNLRPVKFNFIGSPIQSVGFIAQEIEEVLPEVVSQGLFSDKINDFAKGVSTTELIPFLVDAIQEQSNIIQTQNNEITTLKSEIDILKQQIASINKLLGL